MRSVWRIVIIAALWVIPIAAVVVAVPLASQREEASVSVDPPAVVTVGSRSIDNATSVEVQVRHAEPVVATAPIGGTVTTLRAPGPVEVGDQLFSIDGVPVLAYLGYPLFRDLSYGDRGEDVAGLADFLVTLGLLDEHAADDRYGESVRAAVRALQDDLGVRVDGVFRAAYVTRMHPELDPTVTHLVEVGDVVDSGAAVLEGDRPVAAVTITSPEGAALTRLSGEPLVLRFRDVELDLPDARPTGVRAVDLAEELAELATRGDITGAGEMGASGSLPEGTIAYGGGVVALAEPVERGVVPASAVRTDAAGATCLVGADGVTIALSELTNGNELGTALVDRALAGTAVLRDGGSGEC
ncbi:peptidoglycan-binding protein [Pseudactinotalea sp. HY158]|uniref:peptidoglycan-binding domain-containing protein n=1 Tax=Pseudactinotalea sp. HY158 TaxID=2654547 RepID=UPI001E5768DE|nr:peptidoglycan-binding domain-containing protein [Pseudactinotalea sp. HY158]